jgi:hypothetical protein
MNKNIRTMFSIKDSVYFLILISVLHLYCAGRVYTFIGIISIDILFIDGATLTKYLLIFDF